MEEVVFPPLPPTRQTTNVYALRPLPPPSALASLVRGNPGVLRPGFIKMRCQWSYDCGVGDRDYNTPTGEKNIRIPPGITLRPYYVAAIKALRAAKDGNERSCQNPLVLPPGGPRKTCISPPEKYLLGCVGRFDSLFWWLHLSRQNATRCSRLNVMHCYTLRLLERSVTR